MLNPPQKPVIITSFANEFSENYPLKYIMVNPKMMQLKILETNVPNGKLVANILSVTLERP